MTKSNKKNSYKIKNRKLKINHYVHLKVNQKLIKKIKIKAKKKMKNKFVLERKV